MPTRTFISPDNFHAVSFIFKNRESPSGKKVSYRTDDLRGFPMVWNTGEFEKGSKRIGRNQAFAEWEDLEDKGWRITRRNPPIDVQDNLPRMNPSRAKDHWRYGINRWLYELLGAQPVKGIHLHAPGRGRRRNPLVDVPPEYIVDPYKPLPKSWGVRKREVCEALRAAYAYAMRKRITGAVVKDPESAGALLMPLLSGLEVEAMMLLPLNTRSKIIGEPLMVSKGDVNGTDAGTATVLRLALGAGATQFLLAHNHPSAESEPSSNDLVVTRNILKASRVVDCPLVDHLIIGNGVCSLRRMHPDIWGV